MSFEFEWPWLVLSLPLPWLLRLLLPSSQLGAQAVLRVPFLADFVLPRSASGPGLVGPRLVFWLAALAWLCLVAAAMRPLWRGAPMEIPTTGRDLMMAVDLSDSMRERDFVLGARRVNRLQAAQAVASDFIGRRVGDRLGLILFGTKAYLQSPLTFDRETVREFLNEAEISLAGEKTAIGDAIGLAVKHLREREVANRVLILLTDGANTAGEVQPSDAARVAAAEGLRIHTVGIGAESMAVQGFFGLHRVNPAAGLDEATLKEISKLTGGRYFRARDTSEMEEIYQLLDRLEPTVDDPLLFRPQVTLYHWPLAVAGALAALIVLIRVG